MLLTCAALWATNSLFAQTTPIGKMETKFTKWVQGATLNTKSDEIFQCQSEGYCRVFNLKDPKEQKAGFQLLPDDVNLHCNFVFFSPKKKKGDDYPILWYGADWGKYEVYGSRIQRKGDSYTCELKHTIQIPTSSGYFTDFMADFKHNIGYVASYTQSSWKKEQNNEVKISAYKIPFDNLPEFFKPETAEFEFTLPFIPAMQDCVFHKGKLYIMFGLGGKRPTEATIMCVDPKQKKLINKFDVRRFVPKTEEPEGFFIKGRKVYITTSQKNIYAFPVKELKK